MKDPGTRGVCKALEGSTGFRRLLQGLGFRAPGARGRVQGFSGVWEFPKIRGTLFWGPYDKDPTI